MVVIGVQFLETGQSISSTCSVSQNSSEWLTWPTSNALACGPSWVAGGISLQSAENYNVSSFTALDAIISLLKDKYHFPNLDTITLGGFGYGAEVGSILELCELCC